MNLRSTVFLLIALPMAAWSGDFERDFAVVFITQATEARHGRFPLDRSLLAQAVERAADAGAKGVVLKFFFDQARAEEGDRRLAAALKRIPVLLQARMDDSEKNPNVLDARFTLQQAQLPSAVSGRSGWIPLPGLSQNAHDVCFVDFNGSPIPLVETYQGKSVKSLLLCAAELAAGQKASLQPTLSIANHVISVDAMNRVSVALGADASLVTFDFNGLLDGSIPSTALKDRVVVIGYDGPSTPSINSGAGTMGIHRLFTLLLRGFYESITVPKDSP